MALIRSALIEMPFSDMTSLSNRFLSDRIEVWSVSRLSLLPVTLRTLAQGISGELRTQNQD